MTPPALIASRYRVLRELGRGGMGVVYVVEHIHTGDHLALKVLLGRAAQDPKSIERFKREARASARIKSDHVVKVVDADVAPELNGVPFLVMELLNGLDLQKQLEKRGRFAPDVALHYLSQAARALDKSHAIGIVHRDLKPENLFLHQREDGSTILKILDFGISKIVGGDAGNDIAGAGMTNTGSVMGTPLYMSPEQARGRIAEIGPGTDVWAMGLISIQLLSGEIYWRANTVAELMAHIISEPLYAPSQRWAWLPPAIDSWFARSCARDPKQRYASVGEQIAALGTALGRQAPASAIAAEASGPLNALAADRAPLPPPPLLAGARTTTSATAQDDRGSRPRARTAGVVGGGVVVACAIAAAVFVVRTRGLGAHDVAVDSGGTTTQAIPSPVAPERQVEPDAGTDKGHDELATSISGPLDAAPSPLDAGAGKKDAGKGRHPPAPPPPAPRPKATTFSPDTP